MEIQQIQDSIVAAFGNVAAPNPGKIIREMDSKSLRDAEQFRQIIAGRNWTNLDSDFLNKWWSSYYYLSPEAYCYYLPALLIGALKELPNALGLMNLVMFSIRPSFWEIYYNGEDHEFNLQQMNYTEAQFRSVCAFLGMVFESIPHERHRAAQALYWGWNRYDTPELEAANRYYLEMRSFAYPESDDPEIARLFKVIRDAFADTPYPGDDNLSGSDQGDEPAENAMDLRGVKWQSAHPVLLARCYTALSFLTDAGFRYFLPAFLLENLSNYDSNVNPVFDLTRGFYDRTMSSLDIAMDSRSRSI